MTGHLVLIAAGAASSDDAITKTISTILNYGILGIVALALAFRWLVPKGAVEEAREQGRADVVAERDRALARADKAEEKLETQQRLAQEQLLPLLQSFVRSTDTLIPILQGLVRFGLPASEHGRDGG
jgi:hypothetical protein